LKKELKFAKKQIKIPNKRYSLSRL